MSNRLLEARARRRRHVVGRRPAARRVRPERADRLAARGPAVRRRAAGVFWGSYASSSRACCTSTRTLGVFWQCYCVAVQAPNPDVARHLVDAGLIVSVCSWRWWRESGPASRALRPSASRLVLCVQSPVSLSRQLLVFDSRWSHPLIVLSTAGTTSPTATSPTRCARSARSRRMVRPSSSTHSAHFDSSSS